MLSFEQNYFILLLVCKTVTYGKKYIKFKFSCANGSTCILG